MHFKITFDILIVSKERGSQEGLSKVKEMTFTQALQELEKGYTIVCKDTQDIIGPHNIITMSSDAFYQEWDKIELTKQEYNDLMYILIAMAFLHEPSFYIDNKSNIHIIENEVIKKNITHLSELEILQRMRRYTLEELQKILHR